MTFYVDSYLEYFLTMLGWYINNNLFTVLSQTGALIIPLIGVLIKTWLEVIKQGDDEGNKGTLLVRWLSLQFYTAIAVLAFALMPIIPLTLNNLSLDVEKSKTCGYSVPLTPDKSGYAQFSTELAGKQAKIPLLWAFFHQINKGITHAMTAAIPCQPDLRQIRFEVQHEKINDPMLLTEVQQFVQQCYIPARAKLQSSQVSGLTPFQVRETSWIGGRILVKNSELYPRYRAQQPNKLWAYDSQRDSGLPNTGDGGFPRCDQWWQDADVGLKHRLLADMRQNLSVQVTEFFSKREGGDERLLQTLLRPENIDVSNGRVYPGYGGDADFSLTNAANRIFAFVGTTVGTLGAYPAFDALRQALPMVQAFAMMCMTILTPLIILLSGYSLKALVTLIAVNFALVTLTFWWELARWLDSSLLGLLYNSSTHSVSGDVLQNTMDDVTLTYVLGAMFMVLPILWICALGYAGYNAGSIMKALAEGTKGASSAASQGASQTLATGKAM